LVKRFRSFSLSVKTTKIALLSSLASCASAEASGPCAGYFMQATIPPDPDSKPHLGIKIATMG
jgi:hypothetical protein